MPQWFPYGARSVIVGLLAIAALALTYASGMGCALISFAGFGVDVTTAPSHGYLGAWTAQKSDWDGITVDGEGVTITYTELCIPYNSVTGGSMIRDNFDASAKVVQSFAIISMVIAPFVCVATTMPWCTAFRDGVRIFRIWAFLSFFTMISVLLMLLMKQSNLCTNCSYGWSAWTSVAAGALWFGTGVGLLVIQSSFDDNKEQAANDELPVVDTPNN